MLVGVSLGLLTLVKFFDMGFYEAFDRPFNPVSDWSYADSAFGVLDDSIGSYRIRSEWVQIDGTWLEEREITNTDLGEGSSCIA